MAPAGIGRTHSPTENFGLVQVETLRSPTAKSQRKSWKQTGRLTLRVYRRVDPEVDLNSQYSTCTDQSMSHPISSSLDRPNHDLEAGSSRSGNVNDDESWTDPFDMNSTKYASVERLKRWRKAVLVLNSSRRFRYTLNLKKEEEKKQTLRKIRAHAQAIRAASLYAEVGNPLQGTLQPIASAASDFQIAHEQLVSVIRDRDLHAMQQYGGVSGLADLLKTNLHKGILGDSADCLNRKNAFGSNTYPPGRARSFWTILWEAWQDLTLIILMIAAVATLGLHINMKEATHYYLDVHAYEQ